MRDPGFETSYLRFKKKTFIQILTLKREQREVSSPIYSHFYKKLTSYAFLLIVDMFRLTTHLDKFFDTLEEIKRKWEKNI